MDDPKLLESLAAEELLNEAKRGSVRASVSGPSGWQKCPLPRTNKRFLTNTLLHALTSNRKKCDDKDTKNDSQVKMRNTSDRLPEKEKNKDVSKKRKTESSDIKNSKVKHE